MRKYLDKFLNFVNRIAPPQGNYSWFDKLRVSLGVGITILLIAYFNYLWGDMTTDENMVTAVFGVSALCIFLFPQSKYFSPLVLLEANLYASCVAFICVFIFPTTYLGIPFALLACVAGMNLLGCMHPPAAFLSIFIVMAGTASYDFALHPVLVDSFVLAIVSLANKKLMDRWGVKS